MTTPKQIFPSGDPQLMYEVTRDRLQTQLSFIDAVDAKIAMLVSTASALLGIAAAVFALHATATGSDGKPLGLSGWEIGVLSVGAFVYAIVAWYGGRAYLCRDWKIGPALQNVWDQYKAGDADEQIKWGIAADTWLDFDENLPMYRTKERALKIVFVGAAIETLALVLAISLVAAA